MKFAGFLCFLSVHALSLALPADPTAKDVQTQSPLVMENEDTRSVFPEEVDKYYSSKQATPQFGYIWRYKLVPVFVDPRFPHIEYTLVEDQPSEINPQDLQEDAPENAEKSSVDKAKRRLKRQTDFKVVASINIPLGGGGVPSWSVQGHVEYKDPSFVLGAIAGIGGEFGRHPAPNVGGFIRGTDTSGLTGVLGGGWHSRAGTTFGLGYEYDGSGGHIDLQNGRLSSGSGSKPNVDPSRHQDDQHGSHD